MIAYDDLNLRIRADGTKFTVSGYWVQRASRTHEEPFNIDNSGALSAWQNPGFKPEDAEELGKTLFNALFPLPVRLLYQRVRGELENDPYRGVQIRISLDPVSLRLYWLLRLPWELLFEEKDGRGNHLSLDPRTPVVRALDTDSETLRAPLDRPFRVLVVVAEPRLGVLIDCQSELRSLEKALGTVGIKADVLRGATRKSLERRIRDGNFGIVHFLGHGESKGPGGGALLLEKENRSPDCLLAREFAAMFEGRVMPRLVVLNACQTADVEDACGGGAYSGVAAALIDIGLPSVLAIQRSIRDLSAVQFAERFYDRLLNGDALESAITEARKTLRNQFPHSIDWCLPVLFVRYPSSNERSIIPVDPLATSNVRSENLGGGKSPRLRREAKLIPRSGIYDLGEVVRASVVDQDLLLSQVADLAKVDLSTLRRLVNHHDEVEIDFDQAQGMLEVLHVPTNLAVAISGSRLDFDPGSISMNISPSVRNLISTFYYSAQSSREDIAAEILIATPRLSQSLSPLEFQRNVFSRRSGTSVRRLQDIYWSRSSRLQSRLLGSGDGLTARVLFIRELTDILLSGISRDVRSHWYNRIVRLIDPERIEIRWLSTPGDIKCEDASKLSMAITVASGSGSGSGIVISDQPSEFGNLTNPQRVLDCRSPEYALNKAMFEQFWDIASKNILISPLRVSEGER